MANRERGDDPPQTIDRTASQGTPARRRRALRSPGAAEEISGATDAGEEPAAVRRGLEGDRLHAQTGEGARGGGADSDVGYRVAAERSYSARVGKRRFEIALGRSARRVAALVRRSADGSREAEGARDLDRGPTARPAQTRVLPDLQAAPECRRRARRQRLLQRLPHTDSSGPLPAAQARRAGALRRLPSHSPSGEAAVLKLTAYVDGASRGNPGPAGSGVYMTTDSGD